MSDRFQIITFYKFHDMSLLGDLVEVRGVLTAAMRDYGMLGTIIIAEEGFNATVCGPAEAVPEFISKIEAILETKIETKSSFHAASPFKKIDVKIKPEIVTLKRPVDIAKGDGTHVKPQDWNELISDPEVFVLDTRNDYEYESGTFERAVNPGTEKFSDLPAFVAENLDPEKHKKVAMFCTGGIRCEKFAPYMKGLGFENVFQLEGGILKYLEKVPKEQQLWRGECFVFDERRTVDEKLEKGRLPDYSQKRKQD